MTFSTPLEQKKRHPKKTHTKKPPKKQQKQSRKQNKTGKHYKTSDRLVRSRHGYRYQESIGIQYNKVYQEGFLKLGKDI